MNDNAYNTRSVDRAMSVLECFSEDKPELRITDIAATVGLSKATTFRLLRTLELRGYVRQCPESEKYRLGVQTLHLAKTFLGGLDFRRVALPYMRTVCDALGESVNLFVSNGVSRVVIERVESKEPLRRVLKIGDELPLERGAAGKIFMAFANRHNAVFGDTEMELVRRQMFAVSHGERAVDASSVAVPLFDHTEQVIAVMAIAGPTERFRQPNLDRYVSVVVENGRIISRALGSRRA